MSETIEQNEFQYQTLASLSCYNDYNCDHCFEFAYCQHRHAENLRNKYPQDRLHELKAYFNLKRTVERLHAQLKYKNRRRNRLSCIISRIKAKLQKKEK